MQRFGRPLPPLHPSHIQRPSNGALQRTSSSATLSKAALNALYVGRTAKVGGRRQPSASGVTMDVGQIQAGWLLTAPGSAGKRGGRRVMAARPVADACGGSWHSHGSNGTRAFRSVGAWEQLRLRLARSVGRWADAAMLPELSEDIEPQPAPRSTCDGGAPTSPSGLSPREPESDLSREGG